MAKKPSPLKNRLARYAADRRTGVVAASLRPAEENRTLPEVVWEVLSAQPHPLEVTDASEIAERLAQVPAFGSSQAAGWVVGMLGGSLAHPSATAPLSDPKLQAIEDEVIATLGPDATWCSSGDHPLPGFVPDRGSRGWWPVLSATFDRVLATRGNGFDLVIARVEED